MFNKFFRINVERYVPWFNILCITFQIIQAQKSLDDKQIKIQYISFHDYTFKLFSIERGLFITLKKL